MRSKTLFSNKSGKIPFNTEKDTNIEAIDIGGNIPVCPVDFMIGMRSLEAYVRLQPKIFKAL